MLLCAASASAAEPWRLSEALSLPSWFDIKASHRVRYESLDEQFRAGRDGGDQILLLRTIVAARITHESLRFTGELMDSRAALDDRGTPISTGLVNPLELLQANLEWGLSDVFAPGDDMSLRIGRMTMDVGSRRLVARNRFRNTINAFTGADWRWRGSSGRHVRAFFTLPVNRLPATPAALRRNDVDFDDEDSDIKFWGLFLADTLPWGDQGEIFYFGIKESDSLDRATRNRDLTTLGLRIFRRPRAGHYDFQLESVFQFGESRLSSANSAIVDLDHFAIFQHGELGYSWTDNWRTRLAIQYDFASGDDDPRDDDNGRFDTLFGARRFDFGPTSIYGPFARANLHTPGLRLQVKPHTKISSLVAYRAYWLASARDAWTTSRTQDPLGRSGKFIGHQIEARLRWDLVPETLRLESGIAHLFAGEFKRRAPNTSDTGDATYVYSQIAIKL